MKFKIIKKILSFTIIVIVFYFIFIILYKNWSQLSSYVFNFNFFYLILAILFLITFFFFISFGWNFCLRFLGEKLSYKKTLRIWFSANLIRYIPGNIWYLLGRTELMKKEGISREKTLVSSLLEVIFAISGSLTIFFIYLLFWIKKSSLIFLLIPLAFIILHPKIFSRIVNFGLKIIKRPKINFQLNYKKILFVFLFFVFIQIFEGLAFAFLVKSIFSTSLIFPFIGIYEGAWSIGYLSFITPSGLGFREAALIALLKPYMPLTIATLISLIARIFWIVIEVIIALIAIGISKLKKTNKQIYR